MDNVQIYIDESGAHGFDFDKDGVTKLYVISPIIIPFDQKENFENKLREITIKYSNSEAKLKSLSLIKNSIKLDNWLKEISALDFKFFTLIVDKRELDKNEGFKWKPSFYKYFQSICYTKFIRTFSNIRVIADSYGSADFQNSFIKYIEKNFTTQDMFNSLEIKFLKNDLGCQLSDNISGVIRSKLESGDNKTNILNLFADQLLFSLTFPFSKNYYDGSKNITSINVDTDIKELSNKRAYDFLKNFTPKNEDDNLIKFILEYLFYRQEAGEYEYIQSIKIKKFIKENYNIEIKPNDLKRKIIPLLRSNHVLISSCSKGYKLPNNIQDVKDYIEMTNKNAIPALLRLKEFVDSFQTKFGNEFQIFGGNSKLLDILHLLE